MLLYTGLVLGLSGLLYGAVHLATRKDPRESALDYVQEVTGVRIPDSARDVQVRDDAQNDPLRPMWAEACFQLSELECRRLIADYKLERPTLAGHHPCDGRLFHGACGDTGGAVRYFKRWDSDGPTGLPRGIVVNPDSGTVWLCVAYPDAVK